ncbi:hypothetical protein JOD97_002458 [Duganella sp. 1411]|uniref:hypothetical protein n=1 Tax=Duganella sp. 1411 TaxID=2806572 RepID=UPI001AE5CD48|nr:hypothetical protein [Duganella sp. 1411]MBP1204416.1 hypothetical protein [Duganella sp. 1411]
MHSIHTVAARGRARYIRGLAPLLLAVAVGNACAAELIVVGQNGLDGAAGTLPGQVGGDGRAAAAIDRVLASTDAWNTLTLTGGNGGNGGEGAAATEVETEWGPMSYPQGKPGAGGNGGYAAGTVVTVGGAQGAQARSRVVGGNGGGMPYFNSSDWPATDGPLALGGNASSTAVAFATGAGAVVAQADAVGGYGSYNFLAGKAGLGGTATARASGQSDTGKVTVGASVVGGRRVGAELVDAVSGRTRGELSLSQRAEGGENPDFDAGGARSTLALSDAEASALSADVAAVGGNGGGYRSGAGGAAYAELTLASTRAGAAVAGNVSAVGGIGSNGGLGGNAVAVGTLTGTADVTGRAVATGGSASYAGAAAGASASLTLSAGGLARGNVAAYGGNLWYIMGSTNGEATATLTMAGAGAQGGAYAEGNAANSNVSVRTSGALAVDVVSTAQIALAYRSFGGAATATTDVRTAPGGGQAAVRASAYADGGSVTGAANANVRVVSAGDIVAIGRAKGGYPSMCCYDVSGDANSSVHAETSGAHAVSVSAISVANIGGSDSAVPAYAGSGSATAHGRSGSGVVDALADARGGYFMGVTSANAGAVTTDRGGVGNARAIAMGVDVTASASAAALGTRGTAVGFAASAAGREARSAAAYSSSRFSQAEFALPAAGGQYVVANAMAAPDTAGALTLSPASNVGGIDNAVGAGMHAMSNADTVDEYHQVLAPQQTSGAFQFGADAGEHLQLAFLAGAGGGFDLFELTISNHGVQLFSHAFLSGAEADLFFNGSLLDLGPLAGGMQDLLISSTLNYTGPGGYAFNYLVGTGVGFGSGTGGGNGATAVPEASTWLMLVIGMGGMLLMARRRAGPAARA